MIMPTDSAQPTAGNTKAKETVQKIKDDICGRKGGDWWFEGCDKDIQEEILLAWTNIIARQLAQERKVTAEIILDKFNNSHLSWDGMRKWLEGEIDAAKQALEGMGK